MAIERLTRSFEIKALSDDGTISGYGSVFGVEDSYRDVVAKGAFSASLARHRAKGRYPAMLWQHDSDAPIGVWMTMSEDERGLYVEGAIVTATTRGNDAYQLLKAGAISGLSIGYVPKKYEIDKDSKIRTLTEIDLWEVSLVTFPANDDSRVTSVKSLDTDTAEALSRLTESVALASLENVVRLH